jgi:hypothetical protein
MSATKDFSQFNPRTTLQAGLSGDSLLISHTLS